MIINLSDTPISQYEYKRQRDNKIAQMRKVINTWDKSQILQYLYNRNKEYPLTDEGMSAILERFINTNEFKIGDMSEELKTGFDIVLYISKSSKIYHPTTDLIYDFIKQFKEVIHSYDRQSAQTYNHKLLKAYENSVDMVNKKLLIEQEIRLKY